MADELSETYATVDAAGRVTFDFDGNIHARGLELDSAPGFYEPRSEVRWLRADNGAVVASLGAFHGALGPPPGADHETSLRLFSTGKNGYASMVLRAWDEIQSAFGAELLLEHQPASNYVNSVRTLVDDAAGGFAHYAITLDGTGNSSYVRKLADVTVGAPAASIAFTNIPQGLAHLRLIVSARSDNAGAAYLHVRCNSDPISYDIGYTEFQGGTLAGGAANGTTSALAGSLANPAQPLNAFGSGELLILDYSTAAKPRVMHAIGAREHGLAGGARQLLASAVWRPATVTPLSSLLLFPDLGNFVAATRATLYGWGTA